jgi:hypothetical protein
MGRSFLASASHDWVFMLLLAITGVCAVGLAVTGYMIHEITEPGLVVTYQSTSQYPQTVQNSPDIGASAVSTSTPAPVALPTPGEQQTPVASENTTGPGCGAVRAPFTVVE